MPFAHFYSNVCLNAILINLGEFIKNNNSKNMNKNILKIKGKKEKLASIIKDFGSLIVAFSGGVDSSFLLAMANNLLKNNVVAISAMSPIHPSREIEYSKKFTWEMVSGRIVEIYNFFR